MNGNAINQVLLNLPQSGNAGAKQAGSRGSVTADFAQTFQDARKAQARSEKANAQAAKRPANAAHPHNDQTRDIHQAERSRHKKTEKMSPGENAVRSKPDNHQPDRAEESGRRVAKMDRQDRGSSDTEHARLSKTQTESTTETEAESTAEIKRESTAETEGTAEAESTAETNAESTTGSTGESQVNRANDEESLVAVIDTSNLNKPAVTDPLNTTLAGLGQPLVSVQPDGAIADINDARSLLMEQGTGDDAAGETTIGSGFDGVAANSAETSLEAGSADDKAGKTGVDNSADTATSPFLNAQSAAANIFSEIKAAVSAPGDATIVEPGTVTKALSGTLAAATILSPGQVTLTATAEVADQADNLLAQVASVLKPDDQASKGMGAKEAVGSQITDSADLSAAGGEQSGYEKTGFDKMLKTMAQSSLAEAAPRDQATAPTQAASASSALDHLARAPESQGAATLRNFVVQTNVAVPVGQPQWSQAVGEKVLWLAAQNISSAELNLNPLDLGPVQVKVSVNQDQANVTFTSHHPVVREVIDQNLNRLRDMFSEQGLNLVNVDVSDKSFQRHQGESKDQQGQGGKANPDTEEEAVAAVSFIKPQRLVDHYA